MMKSRTPAEIGGGHEAYFAFTEIPGDRTIRAAGDRDLAEHRRPLQARVVA